MTDAHTQLRVVLVDDHHLSRRGLAMLLGELEGVELIGEAADGENGIALILEKKPQIAIVDIVLPGEINGYLVAAEVRRQLPDTAIVLITGTEDALRPIENCFSEGMVHKEDSFEELEACLRAVAEGRHFVSKAIRARLDLIMEQSDRLAILTDREREVILLIAEGCTDRQSAERLGISDHTVRTHRTRIRKKLDVKNTAELTRVVLSGNAG